MLNETSLDTLCGALAYAMGIEPPKHAAPANKQLTDYIDEKLAGKKADRIFLYNPDAIGQWVYEKYQNLLTTMLNGTELEVAYRTVMPSVTPVCFGTFYTGAQPEVHGIQKYEKPVIRIDTIFDALIRAGKKPLIISYANCSMANIFLERDMDYIRTETLEEAHAAAAKAILEDKHDFIAVYNGKYDSAMHKVGPEGYQALAELRQNSSMFTMFNEMIKANWKHHNTFVGFAMDHGCHAPEEPIVTSKGTIKLGTHGSDMPEDLNIVHRYVIHPAE